MDILNETPWWVYLLFVGLLIIGLKGLKSRTLPFSRLVLLPSVFTLWNIAWLVDRTQEHYSLFVYWIVGLAAGGLFGWLTVRHWRIHADRHRKTITLPGTPSTLIFILLVFAIRYYFIYSYEAHPESAHRLFTSDALISGVITGIFIGRSYELYQKYKSYYPTNNS